MTGPVTVVTNVATEMATMKASVSPVAPKRAAITCERMNPTSLETMRSAARTAVALLPRLRRFHNKSHPLRAAIGPCCHRSIAARGAVESLDIASIPQPSGEDGNQNGHQSGALMSMASTPRLAERPEELELNEVV